jgi:hypothetical protein
LIIIPVNGQTGEASTPRQFGPQAEKEGDPEEEKRRKEEEQNRQRLEESRQEAENLVTIKAAGMDALFTELKRYIGGRFASLEAKMTQVSDTVDVMSPNLNSVINELNFIQVSWTKIASLEILAKIQ